MQGYPETLTLALTRTLPMTLALALALALTLTQEGKPRVGTAGCGSRRGPAALGLARPGSTALHKKYDPTGVLPLVGPLLTVNDWLPSVVSVTDA